MSENKIKLELAGWLMCLFGCIVMVRNLCGLNVQAVDIQGTMSILSLVIFGIMAGLFFGANWDTFFREAIENE